MKTENPVVIVFAVVILAALAAMVLTAIFAPDASAETLAVSAATGPAGPWVVIHHLVRQGDTWETIANKYGSTIQQVAWLNGGVPLIPGTTVKVAVRALINSAEPNLRGNYSPSYPRYYHQHLWKPLR